MKKIISMAILLFLLILSACGQSNKYTSTSSYIQIIEKGYSDDYKEAWIIAVDPNNQKKKDSIKIIVTEPMVWNLIEVNKIYFANYSKEADKDWRLNQIEHENDNNSLSLMMSKGSTEGNSETRKKTDNGLLKGKVKAV